MSNEKESRLLEFYKIASDRTRLRILGVLAIQPMTVSALAAELQIRSTAAGHHVNVLNRANLVAGYRRGDDILFQLNQAALAHYHETVTAESPVSIPEQILSRFVNNGKLRQVPTNEVELNIVLAWIAARFETGVRYTQKEIDGLIAPISERQLTLRRYLVDRGYLKRYAGEYWRPLEIRPAGNS